MTDARALLKADPEFRPLLFEGDAKRQCH